MCRKQSINQSIKSQSTNLERIDETKLDWSHTVEDTQSIVLSIEFPSPPSLVSWVWPNGVDLRLIERSRFYAQESFSCCSPRRLFVNTDTDCLPPPVDILRRFLARKNVSRFLATLLLRRAATTTYSEEASDETEGKSYTWPFSSRSITTLTTTQRANDSLDSTNCFLFVRQTNEGFFSKLSCPCSVWVWHENHHDVAWRLIQKVRLRYYTRSADIQTYSTQPMV